MFGIGAPELVLIALFSVVPLVLAIVTVVDVVKYPDAAFERAGSNRTLWIVLPIVGTFLCGVVSIVAAIWWFSSMKQKVAAAAGGVQS